MELCLKITACLLLIVPTFHLASLQNSTDSPGRTINHAWLRKIFQNKVGVKKAPIAIEDPEYDLDPDAAALDSNNDYGAGIPSGSMALFEREEFSQENSENETSVSLMPTPTFLNATTKKHKRKHWHSRVSPPTTTANPGNSSQSNMTAAEDKSQNSTMTNQTSSTHSVPHNSTTFSNQTSSTHSVPHNSTTFSNQTSSTHSVPHNSTTFSNHTHLHSPTTSAPKINATQQPAEEHTGSDNSTASNSTTTQTTLGLNPTSNASPSTTASPSETTETRPVPATHRAPITPEKAPITPEKANMTDKAGASGGSSGDRGVSSDPHKKRTGGAWGAVLGIGVAVALVGLVAYVILKKKHQMGFSHRKLVEVFPSDPVLRLDNSEPLDLNFGGGAYYNPGLQGDNIQMSNFPGHRRN